MRGRRWGCSARRCRGSRRWGRRRRRARGADGRRLLRRLALGANLRYATLMPTGLSPKTAADLAWLKLLAELERRAATARGAALARELPLYDSLDAAHARHEEVAEARALRDIGEPLPFFGPDWG